MKLAIALAVMIAAASSTGCARAHLGPDFGRSFHDQFAVQRDRAGDSGSAGKAVPGLDAQEASIIASSYRRSLAPKEADGKVQPILMVAPAPAGARTTLAPSVPKE